MSVAQKRLDVQNKKELFLYSKKKKEETLCSAKIKQNSDFEKKKPYPCLMLSREWKKKREKMTYTLLEWFLWTILQKTGPLVVFMDIT